MQQTQALATAPAYPHLSPHCRRITPDQRHDLIAEAAYYLAERRGFSGGSEAEDWLEAEKQISAKFLDEYYCDIAPLPDVPRRLG
jgi:hypothetical protein